MHAAPMRQPHLPGLLTLALFGTGAPVAALAAPQDVRLESAPTRWRISLESIDLDSDEDTLLIGAHYDFLSLVKKLPEVYVGFGGYGAVAGDRGGFFLGGVTLGWLQELGPRWSLDGGVFLGGGGGGGGPVSDGWAVRPFLAIEREFGLLGARLELATLDMDAFERSDVQLALGLTLASELLWAEEDRVRREIPDSGLDIHELRATPRYVLLDPASGSRAKSGARLDEDIGLLGIGFDTFLGKRYFLPFEAYGSVEGTDGGFALGLAGLGYSWVLIPERLLLEVKGLVGAGGGGGVDVAGGFAWHAAGTLRGALSRHLALEVGAGYLSFPEGELDGGTLSLGISWSNEPVALALDYPRGDLAREGLSEERASLGRTRFQVMNKAYAPPGDALRKDGRAYDNTLNLIGLGVEQPITPWLAVTGRAFTAWEGDVGGYAEGLLGARLELVLPEITRHHFGLIGEIGAAGGGLVDVEDGLLFHLAGTYRFDLTPRSYLTVEIGKAEANDGSFEAEAITVGVGLDLQRAFLR